MYATRSALVVDDEAAIRYFLCEWLEDLGFDCADAGSAEQALAALEAREFDLMMLDVRMPGTDGFEVLRRTRELGAKTCVVVLTALGDPEIAGRALTGLGADAFIGKPCSLDELQSTIENVFVKNA